MLRFTNFNRSGPILLGIGAVFVVFVLGKGIVTDLKNSFGYAKKPGGIIDEKGLTLYGDRGPTFCPWDSFREIFATTNHGRPILQHLSVSDLSRQGYDRYSSYWLTSIDFLAVEPDALAAMIREHPYCPLPSRNQTTVEMSNA
jgi:hypothetical protein